MELLDEAIEDCTKAISPDSNYERAYYNRSLVYSKKKDYNMVLFSHIFLFFYFLILFIFTIFFLLIYLYLFYIYFFINIFLF